MSELGTIPALLEEWRQLSEAEGQAVRLSDWNQVSLCQARKESLREQIDLEKRQSPEQNQSKDFSIVPQLIALETRNSQWLQEKREQSISDKAALDSSFRNLKKVRAAYAAYRDPLWNSFS